MRPLPGRVAVPSVLGMPNSSSHDRPHPTGGNPDPARLREAVVLAHTVDGAELVMTTLNGQVLTVGRRPGDDLTPCDLRQALVASCTPGGPDCFRWVTAVEVVGTLLDLGGGLYESRPGGAVERWFATSLCPEDVEAVVEACDLAVPDEAIGVSLVADEAVAASAIRVRASTVEGARLLDAVSRWLAGRCMVEELVGRSAHLPAAERRRPA